MRVDPFDETRFTLEGQSARYNGDARVWMRAEATFRVFENGDIEIKIGNVEALEGNTFDGDDRVPLRDVLQEKHEEHFEGRGEA